MKRFGSSHAVLVAFAAAGMMLAPAPAAAQGVAVYTQSACMNARNGAGIGAPCNDGSAVYYNPAALARQNGAISLGATVIDNSGSFLYDTTGTEVQRAPHSVIVPHGWATWRPAPRLGVGLGVFAPYGLAIEWPVCGIDQTAGCPQSLNFEGRFVGYDQSLRGLYLQPTVAYDVIPGRLAIGGGVDLVKGEVEIRRRLDLADQNAGPLSFSQLGIQQNTDFADVKLSGDAWGVTGHVGVLLNVTSFITIGARYMHSVDLEFDGTADFTQVPTHLLVGPLPPLFPTVNSSLDEFLLASGIFSGEGAASDQDFTASMTLPAQAVAGIAIQLDPTMRVMADYQWTQWSSWDEVPVDFQHADDETLILDYQDTGTLRLGVDYAFTDRITIRGGFTRAPAAAKDASVSPFLPDSDRNFFSGGLSFRASERLSLDFFAMAADAMARRGRIVNRESFDQTAAQLNEGLYTAEGQLFGATLVYHFGGPR